MFCRYFIKVLLCFPEFWQADVHGNRQTADSPPPVPPKLFPEEELLKSTNSLIKSPLSPTKLRIIDNKQCRERGSKALSPMSTTSSASSTWSSSHTPKVQMPHSIKDDPLIEALSLFSETVETLSFPSPTQTTQPTLSPSIANVSQSDVGSANTVKRTSGSATVTYFDTSVRQTSGDTLPEALPVVTVSLAAKPIAGLARQVNPVGGCTSRDSMHHLEPVTLVKLNLSGSVSSLSSGSFQSSAEIQSSSHADSNSVRDSISIISEDDEQPFSIAAASMENAVAIQTADENFNANLSDLYAESNTAENEIPDDMPKIEESNLLSNDNVHISQEKVSENIICESRHMVSENSKPIEKHSVEVSNEFSGPESEKENIHFDADTNIVAFKMDVKKENKSEELVADLPTNSDSSNIMDEKVCDKEYDGKNESFVSDTVQAPTVTKAVVKGEGAVMKNTPSDNSTIYEKEKTAAQEGLSNFVCKVTAEKNKSTPADNKCTIKEERKELIINNVEQSEALESKDQDRFTTSIFLDVSPMQKKSNNSNKSCSQKSTKKHNLLHTDKEPSTKPDQRPHKKTSSKILTGHSQKQVKGNLIKTAPSRMLTGSAEGQDAQIVRHSKEVLPPTSPIRETIEVNRPVSEMVTVSVVSSELVMTAPCTTAVPLVSPTAKSRHGDVKYRWSTNSCKDEEQCNYRGKARPSSLNSEDEDLKYRKIDRGSTGTDVSIPYYKGNWEERMSDYEDLWTGLTPRSTICDPSFDSVFEEEEQKNSQEDISENVQTVECAVETVTDIKQESQGTIGEKSKNPEISSSKMKSGENIQTKAEIVQCKKNLKPLPPVFKFSAGNNENVEILTDKQRKFSSPAYAEPVDSLAEGQRPVKVRNKKSTFYRPLIEEDSRRHSVPSVKQMTLDVVPIPTSITMDDLNSKKQNKILNTNVKHGSLDSKTKQYERKADNVEKEQFPNSPNSLSPERETSSSSKASGVIHRDKSQLRGSFKTSKRDLKKEALASSWEWLPQEVPTKSNTDSQKQFPLAELSERIMTASSDDSTVADLIHEQSPELIVPDIKPLTTNNLRLRFSDYDNLLAQQVHCIRKIKVKLCIFSECASSEAFISILSWMLA